MGTTIAAISTGQAPGGIGVVRISGPKAIEVGERLFRPVSGKKLKGMAGYTAAYGGIYTPAGEKLDDGVALVFLAPKSYTGEDVLEISCHGGLYVTRQVLHAVLDAGAVPAGPGEFTRRAFLNGKMDLAQAESVMELIGAGGREAARLARAGGSGALSRRIDGIAGRLEGLAAHLAAWADFPEEDVEEATAAETDGVLAACQDSLQELLAGFAKGKIYREGLRTVIAGRPNVGKSTLMNLLAGRARSIVTPYPGTTRDVVEETVSLGGVPLLLADTAGLRATCDPVEEIGVAVARERIATAQLVLAVFDGSRPLEEEDVALMDSLVSLPAIAVVNKVDLPGRLDVERLRGGFPQVVCLSASSGTGLEELGQAVAALFGTAGFDPSDGELFNDRQRFAAQWAWEALCRGREAIEAGMTLDAVTVCVEEALGALFELTGRKVSEEVADAVFAQFCVGK
ncbi:tRNA uridine-5-carboxymethylaminomethyl(34) synthesis GTPase MnmE [Acutalibacter caecimuris]|uniref:tRNA uridine-5-carboxymethylaminomethyl(34) synthesis GTPase MnmE n=1 Tax=Acutalibacter caecimuris TaxID=3093657 RepID=UPI002AC949BA|nr:tRNA uridine-5-carboxymethylaminomethyl(34) synthesis GTPase MnmE [Acutalibacter sp. M00118]